MRFYEKKFCKKSLLSLSLSLSLKSLSNLSLNDFFEFLKCCEVTEFGCIDNQSERVSLLSSYFFFCYKKKKKDIQEIQFYVTCGVMMMGARLVVAPTQQRDRRRKNNKFGMLNFDAAKSRSLSIGAALGNELNGIISSIAAAQRQ